MTQSYIYIYIYKKVQFYICVCVCVCVCVCMCVCLSAFNNHTAQVGYDTRSIFKQRLTDLNSEFFFSKTRYYTKNKEPTLPYYLPITGERILGCIHLSRVWRCVK